MKYLIFPWRLAKHCFLLPLFLLPVFSAFSQEPNPQAVEHFCDTDDDIYYLDYLNDIPAIKEFEKIYFDGEGRSSRPDFQL